MTWVRLDDGFYRHPKARAVGREGRALYLAALCWAGANLTDGHVPEAALPVILNDAEVPPRAVDRLTEAGLWDRNGDGWVIHDFLRYNPSRKQVEATRERWRSLKANYRAKQSSKQGLF